ncbi:MAG: pimeloyl-ACP methyl ester carboxylesterase [Planctomycetota bacterium]|jgi:pimeloyl-ACP methyl ester carboxylesterase
MITIKRSIARLCALLLAFSTLAPIALPSAQDEEPQGLFRWSVGVEDLGAVVLPQAGGGAGGWASGPNGIFYRKIPGFGVDPTYEVIIRAPYSGSATYPERLIVQIPPGFNSKPFHERAVVVGFHKFSTSEKGIFLNTNLPYEASQRGWLLVAPYGLSDTSFANPQSQASLQAVFNVLYGIIPFNYRRIYAVGFSMGGLNALSYAGRHLDRLQMQFAGVVVHTAPLDMPLTFGASPLSYQILLANSKHFKGTALAEPFEYERVSPVQFTAGGLVDPDKAPVLNFSNRPIYLHTNLADPNVQFVDGMSSLSAFLQQRGAYVHENLVHDPVEGHSWNTLPLTQALDYVGAYEIGTGASQTQEFFADNPGRWLHVDVESISPDAFGRFNIEIAPVAASQLNSFSIEATRDLDEIKVKLARLGLSASVPLRILHDSTDGTSDLVRIQGYSSEPSAVLTDGQPLLNWIYGTHSKELVIQPSMNGNAVVIDVMP